jgi:hypothetical protein
VDSFLIHEARFFPQNLGMALATPIIPVFMFSGLIFLRKFYNVLWLSAVIASALESLVYFTAKLPDYAYMAPAVILDVLYFFISGLIWGAAFWIIFRIVYTNSKSIRTWVRGEEVYLMEKQLTIVKPFGIVGGQYRVNRLGLFFYRSAWAITSFLLGLRLFMRREQPWLFALVMSGICLVLVLSILVVLNGKRVDSD